ncbi:hypothetical protein [Streptomyces sp. NPDC057094]|uniref:hypothetical protein n=2 Tax=unclassified Streptomyces TaxID=2593676 RepID=UPI002250B337|nr:hypothetical protein [Streptomyces sp. NBC_00198]
MQRNSEGHGASTPPRAGADPRRVRLMALVGVVAFVLALPLAVASAGSVGDNDPAAERGTVRTDDRPRSPAPSRSPLLLGLGLATAARCGPELSSPDGVEAQTCVLTQGEETWARTYYRNATGEELSSLLSLMGPGGRTVQINCAVDAEDDPGACETPRERTAGGAEAYTAIAEFAKGSGPDGPLLLRSGSNSAS